jgi:hypothetical protein
MPEDLRQQAGRLFLALCDVPEEQRASKWCRVGAVAP